MPYSTDISKLYYPEGVGGLPGSLYETAAAGKHVAEAFDAALASLD